MATTTTPVTQVRPNTGRFYFWLGFAAPPAGIAIYILQFFVAKIMKTPWYLPAFGTAGVVLVVLALAQKKSGWRVAGLTFVCLLACLEWFFVTGGLRLPVYTGPVAAGKPFPAFVAIFSDGDPFTEKSLKSDQNTALVFFRGRW